MKFIRPECMYCKTSAGLLAVFLLSGVYAHDYANQDEITIDHTNDMIASSILEIQVYLSELTQQTLSPVSWPDRKLALLRRDLLHQREEAGMGLVYFQGTGINIKSPAALIRNPLAGRSVAAGQAVETAYALLKHIDTVESHEAFLKDIHAGGKSSYMYRLMSEQRDNIDLYKALFDLGPAPAGNSAGNTEE